jgi:TonB-linked SusC/RagA family outer membrane protein
MKKRICILTVLLFTLHLSLKAQLIRGWVTDQQNHAGISGVVISVPDLTLKTSTDSAGYFTLKVAPGKYVLLLHSIGYNDLTITVSSPSNNQLLIPLTPSVTQLSEVSINTGYEKLPRERSTGSFSVVSKSQIEQQVSTGLLSRLEAVAGGLMINKTQSSEGSIVIRGLSTIAGPKNPLIVLNNFPYEGDPNNINPNDIESITILKDAAAASIWGTRAGNGVIVITTKKAGFDQPFKINVNAAFGVQDKPNLNYIQSMASSDFIDLEQMLYQKGFYQDRINTIGTALSPVVDILLQRDNHQLTELQAQQHIDQLRNIDVRNQYRDFVYNKGTNQQYSLNMSAGSDKFNWIIRGGYDGNKSTLSEKYQRASITFENTVLPFKNLTLTSSLSYANQNNRSGKQGYGSFSSAYAQLYPYARLRNTDGSAAPFYQYSRSYLESAGDGKLLDWTYYPLTDYQHIDQRQATRDLLINFDLTYTILKGLTVSGKYQYEDQQVSARALYDKDSYFARDLINSFTQIDEDGNISYIVPKGGVLNNDNRIIKSNQFRGQLNYNRIFGDHEIHALAGAEIRNIKTDRTLGKIYGVNQNLTTADVDFTRPYPNYITGEEYFIPSGVLLDKTNLYYLSQFFNASYTYKEKYTASVSARKDAANLFGVNTNDLWNPLWSAGLSWQLAREGFYHLDFLPSLKIRATYGFSGNADPTRSAVTTISYGANSPYTLSPYATFDQFGNPDLKWETVKMMNLAVDFAIKDNRISGSFEYFTKKATDLLGDAPIDPTAGSGLILQKNLASMRGHGYDITLRSVNLDGKFKWLTNWNFSFYKDKVTDYYLSSLEASNFLTGSLGITGKAGLPVYSILAYKWAGLDPLTGDPQGYLNGVVSKDYAAITGSSTTIDDLAFRGSAVPTYYGNIGNTFSWRSLALTVAVSYKLGYFFRSQSVDYSALFINGIGHSDYALRWQKPGDETKTNVPSLIYPSQQARDNFYTYSDVLVEKGDHVRLQYINLSYQPPSAFLKNLHFSNMSIYANISNVGLLWTANHKHIDPDEARSLVSLPNPKTVTLGLRAGF